MFNIETDCIYDHILTQKKQANKGFVIQLKCEPFYSFLISFFSVNHLTVPFVIHTSILLFQTVHKCNY